MNKYQELNCRAKGLSVKSPDIMSVIYLVHKEKHL